MADSGNSGGIGLLGVIIGAAIVIGLGFALLQSGVFGNSKSVDVNIKPPAVASK
jgi:hypothetical protein